MHHFSRHIFTNVSFSSPCIIWSIWSKMYNCVYLCIMVKLCAIFGQFFDLWCIMVDWRISWWWARSSLLNYNRPIPQFPQAEWLNLLNRNAINLDHVFSNVYTVSYNSRDVVKLGKNVKLLHGSSSPAKTIKTHGDWVIAWDFLVNATVFMFKHRKLELQTYGKHIQRFFAFLPVQLHSQVINYDQASWIRAAQQRDVELSNIADFADLQIQWINNPLNPAPGQAAETRPKQSGNCRRSAACRRWNEDRCPNSAANCNYLHVCSKCSNAGHIARDCGSSNKK